MVYKGYYNKKLFKWIVTKIITKIVTKFTTKGNIGVKMCLIS